MLGRGVPGSGDIYHSNFHFIFNPLCLQEGLSSHFFATPLAHFFFPPHSLKFSTRQQSVGPVGFLQHSATVCDGIRNHLQILSNKALHSSGIIARQYCAHVYTTYRVSVGTTRTRTPPTILPRRHYRARIPPSPPPTGNNHTLALA